jgi:ParB family transcriptional regulator, chromosome partitioning protein
VVAEKLAEEADAVRSDGWRWVEVATDFPYGHAYGLRRIHGEPEPMSDDEAATNQALRRGIRAPDHTSATARSPPR